MGNTARVGILNGFRLQFQCINKMEMRLEGYIKGKMGFVKEMGFLDNMGIYPKQIRLDLPFLL